MSNIRHTDDQILADIAPSAIAHMNIDHADALLAYVQAFGGARWAETAQLTALNRHGMSITAHAGARSEEIWVPFDPPLTEARQLRPAVVRLAQRTRATLSSAE